MDKLVDSRRFLTSLCLGSGRRDFYFHQLGRGHRPEGLARPDGSYNAITVFWWENISAFVFFFSLIHMLISSTMGEGCGVPVSSYH
jgi:hypothetical protein